MSDLVNSLSMEFDPSGCLHMAIQGKFTSLMYARRTGSGWETEPVDPMNGLGCDLAVWDDGTVHTVYDEDTNFDLRYARKDSTGWYCEVISWEGYCGFSACAVLDGSGSPHILHSRFSTAELICRGPDTLSIDDEDMITLGTASIDLSTNPVCSAADIHITIAVPGEYSLAVYDISGREVRRILDGYLAAGVHLLNFDPDGLPGGAYFMRLAGTGNSCTRSLVVLR